MLREEKEMQRCVHNPIAVLLFSVWSLASNAWAAHLTVQDVFGVPGSRITMPILIDNATDLLAGDITLIYDRTVLEPLGAETTDLTANFIIGNNIQYKHIYTSLAAASALNEGSGILINLDFRIAKDPPLNSTTVNFVAATLFNDSHQGMETSTTEGTITFPPANTKIIEGFADDLAVNWVDDGSGLWAVSDGVYTMTGNGGDLIRDSHYQQELTDFSFQADVRKVRGDGDGFVYGYGLHLRSDGTQEIYYEFNILYDGRFMVGKSVNWNFSKPIDWTTSKELRTGYGQWNTLKVVARGNILEFYANRVLLATIEDSTFSAGKVGLFAVDAAMSQEPDVVQFDNVFMGDPDPVVPTDPSDP